MKLDVVKQIWRRYESPVGAGVFGYLNRFRNDAFIEGTHELQEELIQPGVDVYFSPGIFYGPRKNENLVVFDRLWADLDRGADMEKVDAFQPSFLWMTSEGNYQAVWVCDPFDDYGQWSKFNKAVTYHLRADKGGWHGSKLLRVPGSVNWKHWDPKTQTAEVGKHLYTSGRVYDHGTLRNKLAAQLVTDPVSYAEATYPLPDNKQDWYSLVAFYWDTLSMSTRALISKERVNDRSAYIWDVAQALSKDGVHKEDAFRLIWGLPHNKYVGRPMVLWETLGKIYDH